MERLPVRYAALACVIAGGLLISGPALPASADPGSGGTGSTTTGGDSQSTNNGATSKGLLSALSTLPGLHWLSQFPAGTAPTIGSVSPPLMNLPTLTAPATAPNGRNLVQAFTLPGLGSAPQTPGGQQPPAVVVSQPAQSGIAPQSQEQRQGANTLPTLPTLPTITVVPLAPSGAPAAPPITINNSVTRTPIIPSNLLPAQALPPPLVLLLTLINDIPFVGPVITALVNATVTPFLAELVSGIGMPTSSAGDVMPATMPSGLAVARPALLSASGPPPANVAPMGMDVPEAPALTPPVTEPPPPPRLTSPDNEVSAATEPVAFRAGYSDYLRNAGMAEITAIAVPGAVAILLFSLSGGFIGYRQARAGHIIRAEGITRFLH